MDMSQIEPQYRLAYEEIWRRAAKKEEAISAEDLLLPRLRPEIPASARKGKKGK